MRTKIQVAGVVVAGLAILTGAALYLRTVKIAVLSPAGPIAAQERHLLIVASSMTLVVVIPVFIMIVYISWKYRAGNTTAKYNPEWDHSRVAETIWWGVPIILITILAGITWQSSHQLDPFKPIASDKPALTIQVVALDWKWLFIYPEQGIATVNYFQFPEKTPVNFQITADAPMNSFWIPQLSGQIYAMSGMSTQLHVMADQPGSYRGSSANISGAGFAGMKFIAQSTTDSKFADWVRQVQHSSHTMTMQTYNHLAEPTQNNPPAYFANREPALYDKVMEKYMPPGMTMADMQMGQN